MATVIEILTPDTAVSEASDTAVAITVVRTTDVPVSTNIGQAVVEVVGANMVQGVFVGATPPATPYEGQVWLDIS